MHTPRTPLPLAVRLGVYLLCRLLLNTARRFAYPFAPVLARGMGVDLTAITSIIALNQTTTMLGVVSGPLTDRVGCQRMLFSGLGLLAAGMLCGALVPTYHVVMAGLLLAGLGKTLFDPAMQAFVGSKVPFHRRGMFIGILEMSWAGSSLVGLPLLGMLMGLAGWRAPFFALAGTALVCVWALRRSLPLEAPIGRSGPRPASPWSIWRALIRKPAVLGAMGFGFFHAMAADSVLIVYGIHLERQYGLGLAALGAGASVVGAGELAGEFLVAWLGDRLGLKRSMAAGLALAGLGYASLPLLDRGLTPFLVSLFLLFTAAEFAVVACVSLCTEISPANRAAMVAGFLAVAGLGRVAGTLLGMRIWIWGGMTATGLVSTGLTAAGLAVMLWLLPADRAAHKTMHRDMRRN